MAPPPLRRQQAEALAATLARWGAGGHAAWVVLPPGGGKTRVGLEAVAAHGERAVVLVPNTAVLGQWVEQATRHGLDAGDDRALSHHVTVLTYQALAVFDSSGADGEDVGGGDGGDGEPEPPGSHLDRLHPNATALVGRLAALGPVTLVLDECHHLLDVWGELLAEILDLLPDARVLALTATPPASLGADEARLVERLFGSIVYSATIPAFVRDGHLAPFRELAAFVEPTAGEAEYLRATSTRFAQLRADLTTPGLTSTGFLQWLDARFVRRAGDVADVEVGADAAAPDDVAVPAVTWEALARRQPALTDAALRAAHAGLLAVPDGARLREQHRVPLDATDWHLLLDDFVRGVLVGSTDPRDERTLDQLRGALPGIGLRLTRRGIVRATSPVDRVVARSAAKAGAVVDIAQLEHAERGPGLRLLALCDFERASAQVPDGLVGVIAAEEGSARGVLRRLVADSATAALNPVLVTARTVACAPATADALVAWLAETEPGLALGVEPASASGGPDDIVALTGAWTARRWVPLLTRWFEAGHGQVLVGTRALLGEGWDARGVNVVVDLTTATTPMAVTQTRGRALRTDPAAPDKVAHSWTVVCVADEHPLGDRDYERLVRKHRGFYAVTDDGLVTDGVTHVHPELTAFGPPAAEARARIGAELRTAARDQARTRGLWRVGEPYEDEPLAELRVRLARSPTAVLVSAGAGGAQVSLAGDERLRVRGSWWAGVRQWLTGRAPQTPEVGPSLAAFGEAIADGLRAVEPAVFGAGVVRVEPMASGAYRIWLAGVAEAASRTFADAVDELVSPLAAPRYVVPRFAVAEPADRAGIRRLGWRLAWGRPVPATVVWHAVPSVLAGHRARVDAFAQGWHRHVSPGAPRYTGSPDGAGVLAAQRGDDPLAVTTAMRTEWR